MSNQIINTLCWIMAALFPWGLIAAESNTAMLSSTGVVTVNGSVSRAKAVFAGDRIATQSGAGANLLAKGVSITLPSDSSIVYGGRQVDIAAGRVLISTTAASGMKARIGNLTVTPKGQSAQFQMTRANGKLALAALDGALRVTDGVHSLVLAAGQMMTSEVAASQPEAPAAASTAASGIPGWVIGAIIVGAIGGIVGGLAATGTSSNPSPSQLN